MNLGGNLSPRQKHSLLHLGRRDGKPTRILVTGASGLLGNKLAGLASKKGHEVFSGYREHPPLYGKPVPLDQTDETLVRKLVPEIKPHTIVNAAALTDVDKCEEQPDLAFAVNAMSVAHLAIAAKEANSFLLQVSTDYVFDGEKGRYNEADRPNPINQYGLSKLKGERAVMDLGQDSWGIARASVVYGWARTSRPNAATYVVEKLSKGERIFMVSDHYSSPTLNTNLAAMLVEIVERKIPGIIHTAGATRLCRYDFAVGLADTIGLDSRLISASDAKDLRWKAKRPRDSSLDVSKAGRVLVERPLAIQEAYKQFQKEQRKLRAFQSF